MTETTKQYFTLTEALEDVQETLSNGYDGYGCDLHSEVFNTDYYIIGTHEAKKALGQYGVFDAIEEIQEYENANFDIVLTDLSNPEKVANMIYYLKGEEAISSIVANSDILEDNWNNLLIEEDCKKLVKDIDLILELINSDDDVDWLYDVYKTEQLTPNEAEVKTLLDGLCVTLDTKQFNYIVSQVEDILDGEQRESVATDLINEILSKRK